MGFPWPQSPRRHEASAGTAALGGSHRTSSLGLEQGARKPTSRG